MVESDGIGKSATAEPGAGEAAQALRAILQTQYLRYMIIGTWALGLLATVGFTSAAVWGINAYDQWGVELGKALCNQLLPRLDSGDVSGLDASTAGLLARLR